jgi:hypothetical protein
MSGAQLLFTQDTSRGVDEQSNNTGHSAGRQFSALNRYAWNAMSQCKALVAYASWFLAVACTDNT